jgi:hypothetical protein
MLPHARSATRLQKGMDSHSSTMLTPPPAFGRTLPVEGREGARLAALLPLDGGGGPIEPEGVNGMTDVMQWFRT